MGGEPLAPATNTTEERIRHVVSSAGKTFNTATSTIGGYLSQAGDRLKSSTLGYSLGSNDEEEDLRAAIAASLEESHSEQSATKTTGERLSEAAASAGASIHTAASTISG